MQATTAIVIGISVAVVFSVSAVAAENFPPTTPGGTPVESEAVIYTNEKLTTTKALQVADELIGLVRANDYRCDSVSGLRPFFFSSGWNLTCNNFPYGYDIEDKGGHWIVTVK